MCAQGRKGGGRSPAAGAHLFGGATTVVLFAQNQRGALSRLCSLTSALFFLLLFDAHQGSARRTQDS